MNLLVLQGDEHGQHVFSGMSNREAVNQMYCAYCKNKGLGGMKLQCMIVLLEHVKCSNCKENELFTAKPSTASCSFRLRAKKARVCVRG